MAALPGTNSDNATIIPVVDFRRQGMVLQWHALGGTWTAYDNPPALVHGIALINAAEPNVCLYAQSGNLVLQIGANQYALSDTAPRIQCSRGVASFGLRRRFSVEAPGEGVLYSHSYWNGQGQDFFRWLAARARDPEWRRHSGRQWSEGVAHTVLRAA